MTKKNLRIVAAIVILTVASLPCIYTHLNCEVLPEDDAFITYRYVDNIHAGNGPVYNKGHRVFGSTTPLYIVWLTFLKNRLPEMSTPLLAVRLNFIHYILSAFFLLIVVNKTTASKAFALFCSVFFLLQPDMLKISLGGMEPFLFLWLILAAFILALEKKMVLACAVAGIATLARPEGAICIAAILPFMEWRKPKRLFACAIAYTALLSVWGIPAFIYFSTPIPHSIIAKLTPLYTLPPGHAAIAILGEIELWLTRGKLLNIQGITLYPYAGLITLIVVFHVAILGLLISFVNKEGVWFTTENKKRCASVVLFFSLFIAFYTITNPLFCSWYSPHIFCTWILLLVTGAYGFPALYQDKQKHHTHKCAHVTSIICRSIPMILGIWMLWSTATAWSDTFFKSRQQIVSLGRQYDNATLRIKAYQDAAKRLNATAKKGSTVLSAEIGALGYYYNGFIIDACGLVSPETIKYLPVPQEQRMAPEASPISNELVKDLQPDYVVSMWAFSAASIEKSLWFNASYELAHEFPLEIYQPDKDLWGGTVVAVYKKRM